MYNKIMDVCEKYSDKIIEIRRDLHKFAETGWLEFRTTSKIAEILENEGIKVYMGKEVINPEFIVGYPKDNIIQNNINRAISQGAKDKYIERMIGYTGLMAEIDTGKIGPCVALRFDMDALEINEFSGDEHKPYRLGFNSINLGCDHACGHDGHMAIGVITAIVLNEIKDKLTGKVKIFFQPAEEGVKGAVAMAHTVNFNDIDYLMSGHIGLRLFSKKIMAINTKDFLATTKLDAHFKGFSSHAGAAPENGRNALLAAASAALNIHAQCQDGRGAERVNVGYFCSGTCRNSVADYADIMMETRGETTEINKSMFDKAIRTLKACADIYDVDLSTEIIGEASCASGDEELAEIIKKVANKTGIMEKIEDSCNMNASEDITCMMEAVQKIGGKAIYMIFGTPVAAPHHNSKFDFDEDVLMDAVEIYVSCIYNILNNCR